MCATANFKQRSPKKRFESNFKCQLRKLDAVAMTAAVTCGDRQELIYDLKRMGIAVECAGKALGRTGR